ncbi:hypothetical protein [Krasilnikovia sp. MM14-A1259]|uniref:hypothetical protein n=1 Tax=Krasilnikovia sp. MM14-A1259 TaxID=3373539 RepID=UPI0037F58A89
MKPRLPRDGRNSAQLGALLGALVSVAANVAHSYIPPTGAPAGWSPKAGAVAFSIFWPVALAVVIEIAARVTWPHGWRYVFVRALGLLPVAVVAAVVSYRHLSGLLGYYGEDVVTQTFGPLAVDGLMLIATTAVIVTGQQSPRPVQPRAVAHRLPSVPAGARLLPLVAATGPSAAALLDSSGATTNDVETASGTPPRRRGRPAADTRKLFESLKADDPKITQVQAAAQLGISRRTLRDALSATT